jgi:hypothetical protein
VPSHGRRARRSAGFTIRRWRTRRASFQNIDDAPGAAASPKVMSCSSPPHSITSSARASNVGGTSRPSVLAVLRLITSSYLVGACTGRSAGFSPLRMVDRIRPVGDQAAVGDEVVREVDRWELVPCQRDDQRAMDCSLRTSRHDQAVIGTLREGRVDRVAR